VVSSSGRCLREFGPGGLVDFWSTSEPSGAPDLFTDFAQPADVTWDGSILQGSIPCWVLPNPSGLNAHYQLPDLVELFAGFRKAIGVEAAHDPG